MLTYPYQGLDKLGDSNVPTLGLGMKLPEFSAENGFQVQDRMSERPEVSFAPSSRRSWGMGGPPPVSPDLQAVSLSTSGDGLSELPELTDTPSLASSRFMTSGLPSEAAMALRSARADVQGRRRRSLSHAPTTRPSLSRNFRRSPYPMERAGSNSSSICSNASAVPLSLPTTSCCSPVEESLDEVSTSDWPLQQGESLSCTQAYYPGVDSFSEHLEFEQAFGIEPNPALLPRLGLDSPFPGPGNATAHDSGKGMNAYLEGDTRDVLLPFTLNDLSDTRSEPDLLGPLFEQPLSPTKEDMKPESSEMIPIQQGSRFDGDLYTPKFVRGQGNKREGFCGLCKPGRWLVLKNSAFWYDKSFSHGISAATGRPFDSPCKTRRTHGSPQVWEGLCSTCNQWIALISNKKKGTTWFRHAYKVTVFFCLDGRNVDFTLVSLT